MVRIGTFLFATSIAMLFVFVAGSGSVAGQGGGTIVGHVHYKGPTPVNPIIRMGADPRCNKLYVGKRPTSQAFVVAPDGAMANVLIDVDGSFPASPAPSTPVVLSQKDCQYGPHVLGARVGQTLHVTNDDQTEHNVHSVSTAGNAFNTTQLINGPAFEFTLKTGEVLHVRCDNHTWMSAYIGIMDNPYFAVSGTDGTFTISNVPAGKQMVKAWHEVMGTQTQMLDVQAGKTTTIDFTFTPAQKPATGVRLHEVVIPHGVEMASFSLQAAPRSR